MITEKQVLAWLELSATVMAENKEFLTDLDAAIGDADHGINMNRGFSKVKDKLAGLAGKDIGTILKTTGMTLMSSVGGASGPLYGTVFMKAGQALAGKTELGSDDLCTLFQSGRDGIVQRGKAVAGDKTMFDVWAPVVEVADANKGQDPLALLEMCVATAEEARDATAPMQAKKGRASYLGERSIGHIDPGAASSTLLLAALCDTIKGG